MLDNETISELKVLENPKFRNYVNMALEDGDFLKALLENMGNSDMLLRWGISTVIVQVSKRKPELLGDAIPFLLTRLENEDNRMVRNNVSQVLLHLSRWIPDIFVSHGAHEVMISFLISHLFVYSH